MTTTAFRLRHFDTVGFAADQGGRGFHLPTAMTIRRDGRIFVASRSSSGTENIVGIQIVTRDHGYFGQIGSYGREPGRMVWPTALTVDSRDYLYLADDYLHRITVYDGDGGLVTTWGTKGSGHGELDGPSGLAVDGDDNLIVVDHRNHRVQTYTRDGEIIDQWGSFGDGDGQFDRPWGITRDAHGYLYVADWRNDRVQKLTQKGEFVAAYGTPGDGDGQLNRPSSVAVDSDGNMFVADWGNQRLQVLNRDGRFLLKLRGEAVLSPWAEEYLEAQADENDARSRFVPVFEVDTDDPREVSARIEPYFWDPVTVVVDDEDRAYVLEVCRNRFQIFERA